MEDDILAYFNNSPFRELVGFELLEARDGTARAVLPLEHKHSSSPVSLVAQGGVTFTLADSVGGAAAISLVHHPTPTIDFRIDYLRPGTRDLYGEAEVVRRGAETAHVAVSIRDADEAEVARGHGVYKTSGLAEDTPWSFDQDQRA